MIEGFTGEKFRRPGGAHNSFTDTLLCWAIYMKSPNLFEKYAKEFAKVHRARLVGTGAPLPAVRAAYLPQSELTGSIPLNVDREGKEHEFTLPLPLDPNYFFNNKYLRRNPRFPPFFPSAESVVEAARIANLVLASPVRETDLTEEEIGYPYGHFSRGISPQ